MKLAYLEDGTRVRIAKKSGAIIPKPEVKITHQERGKNRADGAKDTSPEIALKQTYFGEDFEALRAEFEASLKAKEEMAQHLVFPE